MAIEEVQAEADEEAEKEAKEPYTIVFSRCSQYRRIVGEGKRWRIKERERESERRLGREFRKWGQKEI